MTSGDSAIAEANQRISAGAVEKLIDAEEAIARMKDAQRSADYRRAFEQCIAAIQSARGTLEKDLKTFVRKKRRWDTPRLDTWVAKMKERVEADDLLRWVWASRNDSTHAGPRALNLVYHAVLVKPDDFGPPPGGAVWRMGQNGPEWAFNAETPYERVRVAEPLIGTETHAAKNRFYASAVRPPRTHRGVQLPTDDVVRLCELAVEWWRHTIADAVREFASPPTEQ